MFREDRKIVIREDSVIHKKIFLYVDVKLDGDNFIISQKMISFFGQVGIYENTEKLNEKLNTKFKPLYLDYKIFKEKLDVKESKLRFIEESENNFFDYFKLSESNDNSEFEENSFNELEEFESELEENIEESINEDTFEETNEDVSELEDKFKLILPFIMVFYRGDRKMDYYDGEEIKQNYFYKKKILSIREKFLNKKFLNKISFCKKFIKINFHFFKNNSKNFFYVIKNFNIIFLIKDFLKYHLFDRKKKKKLKKKRRLKMFKNFKLKKLVKTLSLSKLYKWSAPIYTFTLINIKFLSFSKEYSHLNYIQSSVYFISQLKNIKNKTFRRYRRKRRYKKSLFRNFFGSKIILKKILNIIEEVKKKKKR